MRIALPNKGSLADPAFSLLKQGGYRPHRDSRALSCQDETNGVEFLFLRPRDIAIYVANGALDLGITGSDLMREAGCKTDVLLELGFARSTFRFAAPADKAITRIEQLQGRRIATSFPHLVNTYLQRCDVDASIVSLDGAVEVSIKLGIADAIADVVETGASLAAAGLTPFGDPILSSQAVLIQREGVDRAPSAERMVERLKGVLLAQRYMLLDFNIQTCSLDKACQIAPGVQSPTVSPLQDKGWSAVRTMVPVDRIQFIMDELTSIGAKALLVTDVKACRL